MGLIRAAINSATGVLSDQYKEYFYCEAIPANVLALKGKKRKSGFGGNNGSDNVISNGSVIAIADGQCMLIVDQGKVVDVCAEPGEYVYDMSSEPSLFCGELGQGIKDVFANIGKRFTFGGEAATDQRIYYFNTKEIIGNKYGTPNAVPFRVVDERAGIDIDISIRCFGEYSYKIVNPLLFYTNVCGNVTTDYKRELLDSQLKSELLTALQPAFARISEMGIRYSALPGHTAELADALKAELSSQWTEYRGIEIQRVGVSSVNASKEDEDMIKQLQKNAAYTNPNLAAATLVGAQAQAMQDAAKNSGGAMNGFVGVNMAQGMGGINAQSLYNMGAQQSTTVSGDSWTCPKCGAKATGKFCMECGTPKPIENGWTCPTCGKVNTGKFCVECGTKKPVSVMKYVCDKCGWTPKDGDALPKFCPECGDPINENDIVKE